MAMDSISPKERLFRVFEKKAIDRPPVVCPGGMMNAAIVDVMNSTGHTLPEAHHDSRLMAALAEDVHTHTGFENFGIPFCMTVEAEVLGSEINFGTLNCEPKIQAECFADASQVECKDISQMLKQGRIASVVQAGWHLSRKNADVPVIGNLTGPISTAASVIDPMNFLKGLRKDKSGSHKVLDYVVDFLIAYAQLMIEGGATVISVGDPTATGEILGPKMFKEYAVAYLNKLIEGIGKTGTPVIVHICGDLGSVKQYIPEISSQAISTDAKVNLKQLKEEYPSLVTMGNLSTYMLEFGNPERVSVQAKRLVEQKINIIAPACGLSTSSSLDNIKALTQTVKEG
ncbi:uroporphyrinogen decarboxylase like protein [Fibrobacteria bacterium R8-3-H12]